MSAITHHDGHRITVTPGPFGRAYFECQCGEQQTRASKADAVWVAIAHHHAAGGCNCPDDVRALPEHGPDRLGERYTLTTAGWTAARGGAA
jgi:hypothetical protein